MLKQERQAYIVHQVNLHNRIMSSDLSRMMNVSEDTIRRDLVELAEKGKIIKVHGGALSRSFQHSFNTSQVYAVDRKRIIAKKAASLIKDGMFVFTGGGTTIMEMARVLPVDLRATFITGSILAAQEYVQHTSVDIIFIGDRLSKASQITVGAEAILKIRSFRADLCFLGANALDTEHGLTDNDWEVVQVKKAMIESAAQSYILTISEKLNSSQPVQVSPLQGLDGLITELDVSDERLDPYRKKGIAVY